MKHAIKTLGLGLVLVFAMGVSIPQCGSLSRSDFKQVNISGFDTLDDAVDKNSYSYAMEYFQADGADTGHVYIGTGNNIGGLIGYYITTLMAGGEIVNPPIRPPEIRRYRPDLGPLVWEKVFDYRDVETDPNFRTIGFRFMTTLQLPDGEGGTATWLYTATQGEQSVVWRSRTGNYGEWEQVFTLDTAGNSVRWIAQLDNLVYLAVAYDSFGGDPPPGEVWVSDDGVNFTPINQDGFGNPNNRGIQAVIAYNGWIYAGTKNDVTGFEIWKIRPNAALPGGFEYVKVVENGGPSAHNENAGMPIVFKGKLYYGTQLYVAGVNPTSGNGFQGCDIIRIDENDDWETVVGPDSISGYESGFNHFTNAYLWWMEEHEGWLYAGTFDQGTMLAGLLDNPSTLLTFLDRMKALDTTSILVSLVENLFDLQDSYRLMHAGGDIYKSPNGVDWYVVTRDGFGDPRNYGWRTMVSAPDGGLYIGSSNPTTGTQVFRGASLLSGRR
jgi:hypothetical protein